MKDKMHKICGDCEHYAACASWNIGSLANTDSSHCVNFKKVVVGKTIDAVPVVHGKWTEQHVDYVSDCAIDEIQTLKCSVCGLYHTTPYMYYVTRYKFCPNCGARMDGDGE